MADWKQSIKQFTKHENKRIVLLINLRNRLDELADFLKEFLQNISTPYLIIFFNMEIPGQFAQGNLNIKLSEDYLSKDDYKAIDNYVFEGPNKSWYFYKDITKYNGLDLGAVLQRNFKIFLTPRIKNLEIMRRIFTQESPSRVITVDDTQELASVARFYCQLKKIPCREINLRNLNTQVSQKLRFIKRNIIFLLGMILDHLSHSSFLKNQKGKKTFFIDHKIVKNLKLDSVFPGVVACIFDEGLNIRLELLKSKAYYLSLNYPKIFRFLKYKRRCKSLWRNLAKEDDFRKLFYYRDIPIWNLVQGTLNRYFTDDFPKLMENFTFLSGIFKQINVKYIFLRHDLKKTERILVLFAKRKNITTSMLQHGILSETNGHVEPAVDKYFVWGKASIEWFRRFGNSNVEFEVVGNPEFDNILNKRPSLSKAELCRRLGLDVGKDIILFVPQQLTKFSSFWTDDIFYVMAKRVLSAMQQFPNKQLIIKADPYESVQPYREIIERYGFSNAAVIKDIDIYDVLLHSESLITLDSTVALEGMALDMPVIIFNITKREDRVPYVQSGAAIGVYNGDELLSVIQRVIHDKDTLFKLKEGRKKFLQDYAYKIDGNSKQRIKELIKSYDK